MIRNTFFDMFSMCEARSSGSAEVRNRGALLSTAVRYMHWAKDAGGQFDYLRTNVNALEVVAGIGF